MGEIDNHRERTLDPDDWESLRLLAQEMVADMLENQRTVRERPAWTPPSTGARAAFNEPVPHKETPLEDVYAQFKEHILPHSTGNQHPGFFGWVMGNGTPSGMLADMLASGMNAHLAGYDQSPPLVERQAIAWFATLLGFPDTASGLFVSGGTMANMNALAVARSERAGFDVNADGLAGGPRLTVYGSTETHNWIVKGAEFMGLGRRAFRAVPCNDDYSIDVSACRKLIQSDIDDGLRPFCVNATIGTVNTGAIDDVAGLREVADEFGLWLHVDGAFGALAALAPNARKLVEAQSLADSIAFDLHKWGYLPYDIGCVLVKDAAAHKRAFAQSASYLTSPKRGLAVNTTEFADRGVQLSRSFRALKAWFLMKETGADKLGALIQQNIDQAHYLARLVEDAPELEMTAPVRLNVVCFRYVIHSADDVRLDELNEEILLRIQEDGDAIPSHTLVKKRFCIRVAITNHRTKKRDIETLVASAQRHGLAVRRKMGVE